MTDILSAIVTRSLHRVLRRTEVNVKPTEFEWKRVRMDHRHETCRQGTFTVRRGSQLLIS